MTLYFITGNSGKFSEVKAMLPEIEQLKLDLPEIQSLDAQEVIREKLLEARKQHDGEFIVEDTSLCVAGMGGLPGTFIKWFHEALGLEKLSALAIASGDVTTTGKVCIGYMSGNDIQFFEGVIDGRIVSPRGEYGFAWDKIFVPNGYDLTFGEMERELKNSFSMRKNAVEKLKSYLESK